MKRTYLFEMMNRRMLVGLISLAALLASEGAEPEVPGPLASKGELLFEDDFERRDLGDWKVIIPGFRVSDGVLVATQDRADHGSVGRVYLPMKDVIMSFRFKLEGSPNFNVVFDDKNHKGSHAGHICRVAVAPTQIRLGDDKEGIMRNDLFKMRRDPDQRPKADALIVGRGATVKMMTEQARWYTMTIEIVGDEMRVSRDGEAIGYLKSPGIAHPTKESVHFTVTGSEAHFDEVRIWRAE